MKRIFNLEAKFLLLCILGLSASTAWGTDYVFKDNTAFLALRLSGNTMQVYRETTFNSNCVWHCTDNTSTLNPASLDNSNSRYLYTMVGGTRYWISLDGNNSWVVSTTPSTTNGWRNTSNHLNWYVSWYGGGSGVFPYKDQWNDAWITNWGSAPDGAPTTYTVTTTEHAAAYSAATFTSNPVIAPASSTLSLDERQQFVATGAVVSGTGTPAYTQYTYNNTSVYCCNGNSYASVSALQQAEGASQNVPITYSWALSGTGATYFTKVDNGAATTVTYSTSNTSGSNKTATVTVTASAQGVSGTVSATASVVATNNAAPVTTNISTVADLATIASNAGGNYRLMNDIDASSFNTAINNFSGTFDGGYHTISGLNRPLFNSIAGGTVKNLRLDNVNISYTGTNADAGALALTASGSSKIYNCGVLATNRGSVSGTRNVGGLIGSVTDNTHVVNCYNFASVSGGNSPNCYVGGIVGRVTGSSSSYNFTNACNSLSGWSISNSTSTNSNDNPHFCVNTWSIETDNSGMRQPFIEYWRRAGTNLSDANIRYQQLTGLAPGTYHVSIFVRMFNESNTNNPSGVSLFVDGGTQKTVDMPATYTTYNNHRVRYGTVETDVVVSSQGKLTVGLNVQGVQNCNWLAFKNLSITSVGGLGPVVANCMMYGNMTTGNHRSPVYGGDHTSNNLGRNEYNYYRYQANLSYTAYNDQQAIERDDFLTRFPFYRHILNTHRELASNYLYGDYNHVSEIGHWVLDKTVAPFPIIEPWKTNTHRMTADVAANLPATTNDYEGRLLTEMGNNGYLTVNVTISGHNYTSQLPITDMDTLNYDFTWGKVKLPFANEYSGWTRDYSKICTGWRITSVTGGTAGTLTNYNMADRNCTAKDLYNNNGHYVFAQGGNYIVPYGVTAINITANFATAIYISDPSYDISYNASYENPTAMGGNVPTTYHGQTVYTNWSNALNRLTDKTNPNDQALVLVGNFHFNEKQLGDSPWPNKLGAAVTIMSVDEDNNQEPDYGFYVFYSNGGGRSDFPPIRFDFVPHIGLGMSARVTGATANPSIGIIYTRGWFEYTETCVSYMSECEVQDGGYTNNENNGNNRYIVNSGYFIQIVRSRQQNCAKLSYLQIGGNAYVKELYPGSHTDGTGPYETTLRPINVTGGEIEQCFMTGYKSGSKAVGSDIRFFCAGGRIHKWLAAYVENPSTSGVNVTAKIDHARIYRFFGGGTSTSAQITGNINVTIDNSLVDFYCGGPEFGDMSNNKTVTTHATGTTFGEFYGAGFGGTSWTRDRKDQVNNVDFSAASATFPPAFTFYTNNRLQYSNGQSVGYKGFGAAYSFEFILYAGGGGGGVARFYTEYADFSLAQTRNVTSVLTDCTILNNFVGGGCQGTVNGTVTSTLTGCRVYGNVFGGGYKAPATTVKVYPTTQPTYSVYTKETGIFSPFGTTTPVEFTWRQGTAGQLNENSKILYTNIDFSNLGKVTGNISLTVDGCTVGTQNQDGTISGGNVFGGGNESVSAGSTSVDIKGRTTIYNNVYGGGNQADVGGNTQVVIE